MAREAKVGAMVSYKSLVETPRDPFHSTIESQISVQPRCNPNAHPEVVACQTPLIGEIDLDTVYFEIFEKASIANSSANQ